MKEQHTLEEARELYRQLPVCTCCKKPIKGLIVSFRGAVMCQPCKDRTVSFLLAIAEGIRHP